MKFRATIRNLAFDKLQYFDFEAYNWLDAPREAIKFANHESVLVGIESSAELEIIAAAGME